ncbi:MAG: energy transducer TonB [Agarilytica sp.]
MLRLYVVFSIFLSVNVLAEEMLPIIDESDEIEEFDSERLDEARKNNLYCEVEFTVTKEGATRDIKVVDCPQKTFEEPSIAAVKKFKYKPRMMNGKAVNVYGVTSMLWFEPQSK